MPFFGVNYLVLENIDEGTREEALRQNLVDNFQIFAKNEQELGQMEIAIYSEPRIAVLSMIDVEFEALVDRSEELAAQDPRKTFSFKKDEGEARTIYGFLQERPSVSDLRRMIPPGNCGRILHKFMLPLNCPYKDLVMPHCVFQRKLAYTNDFIFHTEADALANDMELGKNILLYGSVLHAIQTVFRRNGENAWNLEKQQEEKITFASPDQTWICQEEFRVFLTVEDGLTDFTYVQHKNNYIPIELFNSQVVNVGYFHNINTMCSCCKRKYKVVGVDKDLEFLASKCACPYEWAGKENPLAKSLRGEKFTRLVPLKQQRKEELIWAPISSAQS